MGLGGFGGGVAVAKFLASQGAKVTVTDLKTKDELQDSLTLLNGFEIDRFFLAGHPEEAFADCQVLVVNPAVKPDNPIVAAARLRGIEVTTEIALFLKHNAAPVIAVTGSNGKSTTTALIHHLLLHAQTDPGHADTNHSGAATQIWLGGNIGISLLERLSEISADDIVILELSSFQLEMLRATGFCPKVAVLTNFTPNHLDWHGTEAAYQAAKQVLFNNQTADEVAIVPDTPDQDDPPVVWKTRAQRLVFGLTDAGEDGAFLDGGDLVLRSARGFFEDTVRVVVPSQLPGAHNRLNIAAAACAAWQAGADPDRLSSALKSFKALPHRLQMVAEHSGRQFWNDSIATTPESAIMALRVFSRRIILLAGGYDKGQDLSSFAAEIRCHAKAVVCMGQTGGVLRNLVGSGESGCLRTVCEAKDFADAFAQAVALTVQGDIVLLSPGCASYGWFRDYRDRGTQFTQLAREWRPVE